MYSIGAAADLLGVCVKTLRRWEKSKKIRCLRTIGGHRRFPVQEIQQILNKTVLNFQDITKIKDLNNRCAIYGRVSSHKQNKRGDLARQIDQMKEFARSKGLHCHKIYQDVGSGLNANRKGLWRLFRDAKNGNFSLILVNYKDRLTRFGYKYLESYFSEFGVKINVLNKLDDKSPESEMVEDLIAIIHSFSGKLYGMRSSKQKILKNISRI